MGHKVEEDEDEETCCLKRRSPFTKMELKEHVAEVLESKIIRQDAEGGMERGKSEEGGRRKEEGGGMGRISVLDLQRTPENGSGQ
jgi:hypothetical protein